MRLLTIATMLFVCTYAMAKEPIIRSDAPQNVKEFFERCRRYKPQAIAEQKDKIEYDKVQMAGPGGTFLKNREHVAAWKKTIAEDTARLEWMKRPESICYASLDSVDCNKVGSIGQRISEVEVTTILGDRLMLAWPWYIPRGMKGRSPDFMVLISGMPTTNISDGSKVNLSDRLIVVSGTKKIPASETYSGGTYPVWEPFDLAPYLEK